ncbi:MAG TPA: 4-hydroxyphenylacetate 3-monooxygenase, oxygenase component [Chloroflexota bacterium]|nr:4-hydroxyphenylacetate 3-monooxygenase, oxygenase component [Chloroflexota bacterium]
MGVRTGAEFLAGLRDEREVWLDGERVADVTAHPLLGRCARSVAELYDLQHDPVIGPRLTYRSPSTGDPVSLAFVEPRSVDDLVRRRAMFKAWADHSGGMLGRSPDYMNTILAGCAMAADYFRRGGAEYGERIVAYYEWFRERDLCATHTFGTFRANRVRTEAQQDDPTVPLHIVGESAEGLVVSGARNMATLGPFADEMLVFPAPMRQQGGDADRYALAFAVPIATPGMRLMCRQSLDMGRPVAEQPLAARYEEMDCVVIFHEVVVPWERVFIKGDVELCNGLFSQTRAFDHGIHQFLVKDWVKAEFILGVAALLAEAIGRTEVPTYQMMLGEIVDAVETLRAYVLAAEADAVADAAGYYVPNPSILTTGRNYLRRLYPRLIEILQLIGSSGLMATPTEADLAAPELAADIEKYYQSTNLGGHDRVRLFRLAWDLACSGFAGRQVLYERFFAGDPATLLARRFFTYDRTAAVARVQALLAATAAEAGTPAGAGAASDS